MVRMVLLLAVLCLSPHSGLAAQRAPAVAAGERVRVWDAGGGSRTGVVQSVSADSIVLLGETRTMPLVFPIASLVRMEVRQPADVRKNAWKWGQIGFVAGAVIFGVTCAMDTDTCQTEDDGDGATVAQAAIIGGIGLGFWGAVGGALIPGERWEPVLLPDRTGWVPGRGKRLQIFASLPVR